MIEPSLGVSDFESVRNTIIRKIERLARAHFLLFPVLVNHWILGVVQITGKIRVLNSAGFDRTLRLYEAASVLLRNVHQHTFSSMYMITS